MKGLARALRAIAVTLALAAGATSCSHAGSHVAADHANGVLRIAFFSPANTLNPLLATQEIEANILTLIFDPLIAVDDHGNDVPVLAREVPTLANGDIARDGLTITYHLRPNVRWHDGAPFTSRDVAFTVAAIQNPKSLVPSRHGYDDIATVATPDALTAVFHLKRPFSPAVDTFFATSDTPFMVLPEHILAKYPALDKIPFDSAPVGTGPFRFVAWARGDHIELVANDRYFLGKPKIRRVFVASVPDENTAVDELRTHELDWYGLATPRLYQLLKTVSDVDNRLVRTNAYDALEVNTTKPPFDDPRVRESVGLAIDKQRLVDSLTYGSAIPSAEDFPPQLWAYDPHAGTTKPDLPRARRLLDAAGWHVGPDGVRRRGGERLAVEIAGTTESVTDRGRGVQLIAMLRRAGFDATLKNYPTSLYYGPASIGGILSSGKYQLGQQTWYSGTDPDDSSQLLCSEVAPRGYNWSRYCNPAMDAAQHVALTRYDRPTRKKAYATVERLLAQDYPFVFLWWPRQIESVTTDLDHFRPNGFLETWNAYQWSFKSQAGR